jgi:hypothetical protein
LQNQSSKDSTNEEEEKKKEEERKKEEKLKKYEENRQLKKEKVQELENLKKALQKLEDLKHESRESKIHGFSMMTSFHSQKDLIVASWVLSKGDKHFLNVKTISYFSKYLEKFISNQDKGKWVLDLHESFTYQKLDEIQNKNDSQSGIQHALTHWRFSVNTLFPLFVGYQSKKNWTIERNKGPSTIFDETNNREIELKTLKEVYGWVTLKDFFSDDCSGVIGIYGDNDGPVIIPIEVNPNQVKVNDAIPLNITGGSFKIKWENGYAMIKSQNKIFIHKVILSDISKTFSEIAELVEVESENAEVSCIDVSRHSSRTTDENISQLTWSLDSPAKKEQLLQLMSPSDSPNWVIMIKDKNGVTTLSLGESSVIELEEDKKRSSQDLENEEIEISQPLIDRKMLTNTEDFDAYESLIQGKTLQKPAFLIDPNCENVDSEGNMVFDVTFERPLSLFCLGVELYFDAKKKDLIAVQGIEPKGDIDTPEQENSEELEERIVEDTKMGYEEPKAVHNLELVKSENNWIPLIVYTYQGCAFNATSQSSKLVSDDKRSFGANYADSHFIFSHQFGKKFIINQYIVMSENSSQIGAFPMGSGILFVGDTLTELQETTPFHSFTLKQYLEWKRKRSQDPRPLQPYEPVGYFEMGNSWKIIDKIASKNPWKYVKLVPTAFKKTANNSFPQERFATYPIELKFFGVVGEELDARLENEIFNDTSVQIPTIQKLSDTRTLIKIQINNKEADNWETVHEENSSLAVNHIQTTGMGFNIPSTQLEGILHSLPKTITGVHKQHITNSKIQAAPIQKLRLLINNQSTSPWRIWGVKLSPKVLLSIKKNNKGVFSHIPVKLLRSCILNPSYFEAINKQIVLALTDNDIEFGIRMRAIRTLNLIISLNPKMVPLIFKTIDLKKFMNLLFTQDSRNWRHIVSLFKKFYETEELNTEISEAIMEKVQNIHTISMTNSGLEAFISLILFQHSGLSENENFLNLLFSSFYYKISKTAIFSLLSPEYTLLRKLTDSSGYPFDSFSFSSFGESSITHKSASAAHFDVFRKQGCPLPYTCRLSTSSQAKEFDIDLGKQCFIRELRLLFGQTKSKAYRFRVAVFAKASENEILLFSADYDEDLYWYLTQNSYLKEYGLYDDSEEREALSIGNLGYICRHLRVQISFYDSFMTLNGKHSAVEDVFPEIYGEARSFDNEEEKRILINEEEVFKEQKTIGHSCPFTIVSVANSPFKYLQWCPRDTLPLKTEEKKDQEQNLETPMEENKVKIMELQEILKEKLWNWNSKPRNKRKDLIQEIEDIYNHIEEFQRKIPIEYSDKEGEIVHSLEYQMWLANKFSSLLYSVYSTDKDSFARVLRNYNTEEIIYDLFVLYIIKNSLNANDQKHR